MSQCFDYPYFMRSHQKRNGKPVKGYCSDIAIHRTAERCANIVGATDVCPVTCGTCDQCNDPPSNVRFRFENPYKNGKMMVRNCPWVAQDAATRCPMVQDVCRATCGLC